MDLDLIWKTVFILVAGIVLLRISGRKSISQMTIAQTIIMISIGTLLIQPVANKSLGATIVLAAILVGTLLLIEWIQLKWDWAEGWITGRAKVVIENGQLQEQNLKQLRLSVDQLETHLRQNGVGSISDVQWATIEPSGQLGYTLLEHKKPATKEDIDQLLRRLDKMLEQLNELPVADPPNVMLENSSIFNEIQKEENPQVSNRLQ